MRNCVRSPSEKSFQNLRTLSSQSSLPTGPVFTAVIVDILSHWSNSIDYFLSRSLIIAEFLISLPHSDRHSIHLSVHKYVIAKQLLPPDTLQNIDSNMTSALNSKHSVPIVQKRIDNRAQLYPPLDYSFHNAQRIEGEKSFKFYLLS